MILKPKTLNLKPMRALIHDPYLDTLGGGERYCLTLAECLLSRGWQVDLAWDDPSVIETSARRFGLKLSDVHLLGYRLDQLPFFKKSILSRGYDLVFWLSDGSIPFLFGKKNLLHFQVPFFGANRTKVFNKFKLGFIAEVVCNSFFTKSFIDCEFGVRSLVLYPPVDVVRFKPAAVKENIILAVARFEESMQAKRQDILISAFKQMVDQGLAGWELVLAGASLAKASENEFLVKLKKMVKGYPIRILVNLPFDRLRGLYSRAKLFWHAAGFGINDREEPWRVEHFGITPVEAMAAGAVPLVVDKGGLKEIVRRGVGERWRTVEELIDKSFLLIKNKKLYRKCQKKALFRAKKFSKNNFYRKFLEILGNG
ncbi:MAG: glycosyltransferase family 4 protein [Patescibacteria group bacterium]|nr:glycosyltransferase family 4 protein [Patescibacteria group bacterium]